MAAFARRIRIADRPSVTANGADGDGAWDGAAAGGRDVADSHVQWGVEVRCDLAGEVRCDPAGDGVVRAVADGDPGPAALRSPLRLLWV